MADVNANINILINSSQAATQLRKLSAEISNLNRNVGAANSAAAVQQAALNRALVDGANASRMFDARMVPVTNSVSQFTRALEKNKLSLGEYTRYAASQLPGLGKVFAREWDMMERVATERVKKIQTQYVALGKSAKGLEQALAFTPTALGKGLATDLAIATQRAQLFNKMIDDGSTKMLNWGKNTQWAGRQLMVGFSLPLAALGAVAAQTFMELDKATLSLERVYGDLNTTTAEVERNSAAIKGLGEEYTKYGIAVKDTIGIAARAAATGATNEGLMAATEQTLRFATLGQIDYNQALDTTISLQTAFGISNDELAQKIDYLNAVENQTILTIEDMSLAIPRVATVVKGLGGDVEDLAVMMTAMREGGVSAENAANGLKSGLASLINPTDRATESLAKMGVNIDEMISENRGNLMGLIGDFGKALNAMDDFSRQQVLEQVFGKYQYARMSALFDNIANSTSQASRAMELAGYSAEELGQIADKELSKIAETTTVKFQAAMEQLKVSIAPLGEAFLKGVMPIIEGATKIAEAFNNLPDGVKNAIAVVTGVVAGLGPVFLMTIGLVGNGIANLVKGIQFFRKTIARVRGDASAFNYLADSELDAATAAAQLDGKLDGVTNSLLLQQGAVAELTALYGRLAASMRGVPSTVGGGVGGARGGVRGPAPMKMARGGIVPGSGNKDSVPALLMPGEAVINKDATQKFGPVLAAMNDGSLKTLAQGEVPLGGGASLPVIFDKRSLGTDKLSQTLERLRVAVEQGSGLTEEQTSILRQELSQGKVTTSRLVSAFEKVGVDLREQRAMPSGTVGAHLTERVPLNEMGRASLGTIPGRGEGGLSIPVQRLLALADNPEFSEYVQQYSGLTARLSQTLNTQLQTGAAVADFQREWTAEGSRLLPSLQNFGGYVADSAEDLEALSRFERELGKNVVDRANAMNNGVVTDTMLAEETRLLIDKHKSASGALGRVARAADQAATTIVQAGVAMSREQAELLERQGKVVRETTSEGSRFKVAPGQQGAGAVVGRLSNDGTWRPERVGRKLSANITEARQVGMQEGAAEVEGRRAAMRAASTEQDDLYYVTRSRRRNSPHPQAAVDGRDDGAAYEAARTQSAARFAATSGGSVTDLRRPLAIEAGPIGLAEQASQRAEADAAARRRMYAASAQVAPDAYSVGTKKAATRFVEGFNKSLNGATTAISTGVKQTVQRFSDNLKLFAESPLAYMRDRRNMPKAPREASMFRGGIEYDENGNMIKTRSRFGAGMARGGMAGGMALSMGSMLPMMMQDQQGKFMGVDAGTASMGMMGGGMLMSMIGMVPGPLLAVAAAAGAAGLALKVWRDSVNDSARKAAEFGANLGGTANALNNMASMMGKLTPAQAQTKATLAFSEAEQEAAYGEFGGMLESESGQAFLADLREATSQERFAMLTDYVRSAVAAGMMDNQTAELFAKTVATNLNDSLLGIQALNEIKKMESGLPAMQEIAAKRDRALAGNYSMQQARKVAETGQGLVSYKDASVAIGGSIQAIQDHANVIAIAKQQYENGEISFNEMTAAVQASRDAQNAYTSALKASILASTDRGASEQALDSQLTAMGYDEAQLEELTHATDIGVMTIGDSLSAYMEQYMDRAATEAGFANRDQFQRQDADAYNAAKEESRRAQEAAVRMNDLGLNQDLKMMVASGQMDLAQATSFGRYMMENPLGRGAQEYTKYAEQGKSFEGMQIAMVGAEVEEGLIPGLTEKDGEMVMDVAVNYVESGGTAAEFLEFINSVPEEKRVDIIASLQGLTPEQQSFFMGEGQKMTAAVGAETSARIQSTEQYKQMAESGDKRGMERTTRAVEEAKAQFGEDTQAIIDVVLKETPPDLNERLPLLTGYAKDINDNIPPEIMKIMDIQLSNPEDLEKYGPMAEDLKVLSDIVMSLPEEQREMGVKLMLDENGKPKNPIAFAKDVRSFNDSIKKLDNIDTKDVKARKKVSIQIVQQMTGPDGKKLSVDDYDAALQTVLEQTGLTEAEFFALPADVITKTLAYGVDSSQFAQAAARLRAAAAAARAAGVEDAETARAINRWEAAASALEAQAQSANADIQSTVGGSIASGAGGDSGDDGGGGGGSGGGGEKSNPYKDLKKGIADQLKTFADMEVSLKNLLSKKNSFFKLLNEQNGIDDKIRKAGLGGTALGRQIQDMDPKDAQKVLKKITDKKGRLNKEGQKLEDAALAGSIAQRTSEASDRIQGARAQGIALERLKRSGAGAAAIGAIAGDPEAAREYIELVNRANAAEQKWEEKGSKRRGKLYREWQQAQKAVSNYVNTIVEAQRIEAGMASRVGAEQRKAEIVDQVALMDVARQQNASDEVIDQIRENPELANEYAMLNSSVADAQDKLNKALKGGNKKEIAAARRELAAAKKEVENFPDEIQTRINFEMTLMTPEELAAKAEAEARKPFEEQRKAATDQYNLDMAPFKETEAEFEVAFNKIEDKYRGAIKAGKDRAKGLQKEIDVIQEEIDGLQDLNTKDQIRIRGLERQKEMLNRQIEATERLNELDQRKIEALNRQIEMINRQVEKIDRANELDQRRIDALSRQSEMITRQIDTINREIEAAERLSELDQRKIDQLSREDELRQRTAEALSRELELMGRTEEKIREAYDERIKKLDEIERANQRINQQNKDQLDLAKALATGDIYAATAAAQQMRENQMQSSRDDARKALDQGMQNQIAGLRTAGGLTREQAEGQIEAVQDQSYQTQLAIRDIQDQIYTRTQEMIPLRDRIYQLDQQTRDVNDQILVIQDAIYEREQQRIPFLDQIYGIEGEIRVLNDAIYDRNLNMIPIKDQIFTLDTSIRDIADDIYDRETAIIGIQQNKLKPKQDLLKEENKNVTLLEEQMAAEKESLVIDGLTYDELKRQMDARTDNYNLEVAMIDAAAENAAAAARVAKNWEAVADRIAAAVRTAKQLKEQADNRYNSQVAGYLRKAEKNKKYDPTNDIQNARRIREDAIAKADADRAAAIAAALSGETQRLARLGFYTGGAVRKYANAGMVAGDGSRDSVLAKLTPGEFVVRKAMVDKYGLPLLTDINNGSFELPKYKFASSINVSPNSRTGANIEQTAPAVYNTYSVNVNVPNAQVNPDEVANKVMQKIKAIESNSVRGFRGF